MSLRPPWLATSTKAGQPGVAPKSYAISSSVCAISAMGTSSTIHRQATVDRNGGGLAQVVRLRPPIEADLEYRRIAADLRGDALGKAHRAVSIEVEAGLVNATRGVPVTVGGHRGHRPRGMFRGVLPLPLSVLGSSGPFLLDPWSRGRPSPSPSTSSCAAERTPWTAVRRSALRHLSRGWVRDRPGPDGKRQPQPLDRVEGRQRHNAGVTEITDMPNRGHSLNIDHGSQEVAQTAPKFIQRFVPAKPGAIFGRRTGLSYPRSRRISSHPNRPSIALRA